MQTKDTAGKPPDSMLAEVGADDIARIGPCVGTAVSSPGVAALTMLVFQHALVCMKHLDAAKND